MQETQVRSLGQADPLTKEMATIPVLLPGKFHGWRNLVGYSLWDRKESDTTEQLHWPLSKRYEKIGTFVEATFCIQCLIKKKKKKCCLVTDNYRKYSRNHEYTLNRKSVKVFTAWIYMAFS